MTRLKRVGRDALTIERRRTGGGFAYFDADGKRIRDPSFRERARHLAIPPAWTEVRIAPHPSAHIQACGVDAAGRLQYLYHPDWEERRTLRKQRHLTALATVLPRLRRRVRQDLEGEAGNRSLALAIGVALIDRTAMRVGRERYLSTHGTRGASTLFSRDVTVEGDAMRISFPAKSGKRASYRILDATLASAVARVKTIPGRRLLMYLDEQGNARAVSTEQLNAYLKEIAGAPISAKDFRTLHASALAAEALAKMEPAPSDAARKRQISAVVRQVAAFLQNTPAICRKSYVAPCLFTLFGDGKLAMLWGECGSNPTGLRQREWRLGSLLSAVG